jgi:hypothetical protein
MENRRSEDLPAARRSCRFSMLLPFAALALAMLGGCASLGEPTERKPPVPATIRDLSAEQAGNEVTLSFTVPTETVEHRKLVQPPTVEIYRATKVPSPAGTAAPPGLIATIPSAVVASSTAQGRFRYVVSLTAGDFAPNAQTVETFTVRARASDKKESDRSNAFDLAITPAPNPIDDLQSQVTQSAIQLSWSEPAQNLLGQVPTIAAYHIYRANAEPATGTAASDESASNPVPGAVFPAPSTAPPKLDSPFAQIGDSTSLSYRDATAQLEKTYAYSVRSAVQTQGGKLLESADSNITVVTLRDIFPPGAPTGLVVVPVPAEGGTPAHLDLSWDISPETDIGGYNVYRSEGGSTPVTKQNPDLLPTPTFRDMNAMPGHRYTYSVTSVDRTGNESPRSAPVESGPPDANP